MTEFKTRAYGFAVIKAINSNYNADFSGQPRTLPNGLVYANGTTLKYGIRNFIKDLYDKEKVFVFKRYNDNFNPFTLADSYNDFFKTDVKNEDKKAIIKNLLTAIDVRFFGATFSPKGTSIKDKNVSIYGAVQINDGLNRWYEGNIFTDQILSPYGNPPKKNKNDGGSDETEKAASTLGRKSKLEEGHYIHHFSINPKNIEEIAKHGEEGTQTLSENDINLLKEGLRKGATYYDSAAKAGVENEILFYVELNEGSKLVLPNFTEMVTISDSKKDGKRYFNLANVKAELDKHPNEISKCEIYFNSNNVVVENLPDNCIKLEL